MPPTADNPFSACQKPALIIQTTSMMVSIERPCRPATAEECGDDNPLLLSAPPPQGVTEETTTASLTTTTEGSSSSSLPEWAIQTGQEVLRESIPASSSKPPLAGATSKTTGRRSRNWPPPKRNGSTSSSSSSSKKGGRGLDLTCGAFIGGGMDTSAKSVSNSIRRAGRRRNSSMNDVRRQNSIQSPSPAGSLQSGALSSEMASQAVPNTCPPGISVQVPRANSMVSQIGPLALDESTHRDESSSRPAEDDDDENNAMTLEEHFAAHQTQSPGPVIKERLELAEASRTSPGTVKERLRTFSSPRKSPKTPNTYKSSPGGASASVKRTKRLKGRWPPVTPKKAAEERRKIKLKEEIQKSASTGSVKKVRSRFEKRSLSMSGIPDSLPFGSPGGGTTCSPHRRRSLSNVVKPDVVKSTKSKFESLSVSEHGPSLPPPSSQSVSSEHSGGGESRNYTPNFYGTPKVVKRDHFGSRRSETPTNAGNGMSPIDESGGTHISMTTPPSSGVGKGRRRTNYRIRYDGPTSLKLADVYGNDNHDDYEKRQSHRVEKASNKKEKESNIDDDDDSYSEDEESLNDGELFTGGKRPDIWFTPGDKEEGNWRVKRVWDNEAADDMEIEHDVPASDLMKSISDLLGVPEDYMMDETKFYVTSSDDGDSKKAPFSLKMVYDISGEILEDDDDMERSFSVFKLTEEITDILERTAMASDEESDDDEVTIGDEEEEEGEEYDKVPTMTNAPKMTYGAGGEMSFCDESMNDLSHLKFQKPKMAYGNGDGGLGFDESFNDLNHRKVQATKAAQAKMAYGDIGDGLGFDESFNDLSHRKVQKQGPTKMAYGDGEGLGFDESFNDLSHRKMEKPTPTKMAFGAGEGLGFDDSFNDLGHRKIQIDKSNAKMAYGGGEELDMDDSFNNLGHRKIQPVQKSALEPLDNVEEGRNESESESDLIAPTAKNLPHSPGASERSSHSELWFNDDAASPRPSPIKVKSRSLINMRSSSDRGIPEALDGGETQLRYKGPQKAPSSPRTTDNRELWFNDERLSPKVSPAPLRRPVLRGGKKKEFVATRSKSLPVVRDAANRESAKDLANTIEPAFENESWEIDYEDAARKYYKGKVDDEPSKEEDKGESEKQQRVLPWKKKVEKSDSPKEAREKKEVKLWWEK